VTGRFVGERDHKATLRQGGSSVTSERRGLGFGGRRWGTDLARGEGVWGREVAPAAEQAVENVDGGTCNRDGEGTEDSRTLPKVERNLEPSKKHPTGQSFYADVDCLRIKLG
jgi:hypothetical protein